MFRKIPLPLILFCSILTLHGQSPVEEAAAEAVISGTEKIARKMISAAFSPMTGYSEGDLLIGATEGISLIGQVWEDPRVTGRSLWGYTLGGGAGYALTDRLALYGIADGLTVNGRIKGDFFTELNDDVEGEIHFHMAHLFAGAGYDIIDGGNLSLPLYGGLHVSACAYEAVLDEVDVTSPLAGSAEAVISGSGFTPGVSGGIACEYRLNRFALGGYAVFMADFSGLGGESEVKVTPAAALPVTVSLDHETDPYFGGTYGFSAEFSPAKKWSFGLDFSDFLPLPEKEESSVEMSTLAFTLTYRGD